MNVLYLVSATGNPLYEGQYELYDRYMTFGQQSFIYDLIVGLARNGAAVTLAIDNASRFPLAFPLRKYCNVIDPSEESLPESADLVLLDEGADRLLSLLPPGVPTFRMVHHWATPFSDDLEQRCQRFICHTENSLRRLSAKVPVEKLALIHQGVDLQRFEPQRSREQLDCSRIRVLIYSRLDANRGPTIWNLLEELESSTMRVTLLGDGDTFWSISDRFGSWMTPVHFIPCTSIQNFLPAFDVVISSARGVMEALAMGIPAICGGFEYAGQIRRDNIRELLKTNITGVGMGVDPKNVQEDVRTAVATKDSSECRKLAEDFCSVDRFIAHLIDELGAVDAELARKQTRQTVSQVS